LKTKNGCGILLSFTDISAYLNELNLKTLKTIKSIFNLIRDLKSFEIKLQHFKNQILIVFYISKRVKRLVKENKPKVYTNLFLLNIL